MKTFGYLVWKIRLFIASLFLGEPVYKYSNQEIRHNIISSVLKIKWLSLKNKLDKNDYEEVCRSCNIICEEIDKVK